MDTKEAFIALLPERQDEISNRIHDFLQSLTSGNKCQLGDLDTLTGNLSNAAYVLRGGRASLTPLYAAKQVAIPSPPARYPPQSTKVSLTHEALAGLQWWLVTLTGNAEIRRYLYVFADGSMDIWDSLAVPFPLSLPDAPEICICLQTDASATGYALRENWSCVHINSIATPASST